MAGQVDVNRRFVYYPPKGDQAERYQRLRDCAKGFAELIDELVPDSREKAVAMTNLEQAMMWANAGIARNE